MKFLKDNWFKILIVIAVCIGFLYLGKCSARKDIEGIMKANKEDTEALQKVIDDLGKARTELNKSIEEYNEKQTKVLEWIARLGKEIAEIKKDIGEIPAKKVFTDLAACNQEYAKLHVTATAQGQLIIKYEQVIAGYESFKADADAKELQWIALKKNLETEIGVHKSKILLDKALIEKLTKKNRPDLIVPFAGVYWDPVKSKGGFAIGIGLNLSPAIKLVKKLF